MQIRAGFKKEWLLMARTKRLLGLILVFVGFAIINPLMISGMMAFAEWYDDLIGVLEEEFGENINIEMSSMMEVAYGKNGPRTEHGMTNAISNVASTNIIIMAVILIATAGSEQKKRSVIIPQCSGLRDAGYVIPKFVFYPLLAFALSFLSNIVSYIICLAVFPSNAVTIGSVAVSGLLLGMFMAFVVILQLFIGICTGRPGVAATIVILLTSFGPTLLQMFGLADKFNPMALMYMSMGAVAGSAEGKLLTEMYQPLNIGVTIAVTVILSLMMFFLTLLVRSAKRIENADNDIII